MSLTPEHRFWDKVDKTERCWLWTAAKFKSGYGAFGIAGRTVRAHRFAWELNHGPAPEGAQVLHTCDTPHCVNPDHLVLGDHKLNMEHRWLAGHYEHGYRSPFVDPAHRGGTAA